MATLQQLVCDMPAVSAGSYFIKVEVPGKGYAAHGHTDNAAGHHMFESLLSITSISPRSGSLAGGTVVTVSGSGFSPLLRNNTVQVQAGSRTKVGHVLGATENELVFVTPAFERTGFPVSQYGVDLLNADFEQIGTPVEWSNGPTKTRLSPDWLELSPTHTAGMVSFPPFSTKCDCVGSIVKHEAGLPREHNIPRNPTLMTMSSAGL